MILKVLYFLFYWDSHLPMIAGSSVTSQLVSIWDCTGCIHTLMRSDHNKCQTTSRPGSADLIAFPSRCVLHALTHHVNLPFFLLQRADPDLDCRLISGLTGVKENIPGGKSSRVWMKETLRKEKISVRCCGAFLTLWIPSVSLSLSLSPCFLTYSLFLSLAAIMLV